MVYIVLKDNKIIHVCETTSEENVIASMAYEGITGVYEIRQIPNDYFQGKVGNDIREFDSNYELLPLSQRKDYVEIPEGKKIENDEFVDMTVKDKIDAGIIILSDREKWDEEIQQVRPKTISELVEDGIIPLSEYKTIKNEEISNAYSNEFINGHFPSDVLEIEIDYRRNTTKNDLQNVEVLIEYMTDNNILETEYKGYQNQKINATLANIILMRKEMINYSIYLYGKKEQLEIAIEEATTKEQLDLIKW